VYNIILVKNCINHFYQNWAICMEKGHSLIAKIKKSELNIISPNWVIWSE